MEHLAQHVVVLGLDLGEGRARAGRGGWRPGEGTEGGVGWMGGERGNRLATRSTLSAGLQSPYIPPAHPHAPPPWPGVEVRARAPATGPPTQPPRARGACCAPQAAAELERAQQLGRQMGHQGLLRTSPSKPYIRFMERLSWLPRVRCIQRGSSTWKANSVRMTSTLKEPRSTKSPAGGV
jgi:hypothetical protein